MQNIYVIMGDDSDYDIGGLWIDSVWLTEESAVENFMNRTLFKTSYPLDYSIYRIPVGVNPKGKYGSSAYINSFENQEDITPYPKDNNG